jgi:hypothetical protein
MEMGPRVRDIPEIHRNFVISLVFQDYRKPTRSFTHSRVLLVHSKEFVDLKERVLESNFENFLYNGSEESGLSQLSLQASSD